MARYDRHYDYGLRGRRDPGPPRQGLRSGPYDREPYRGQRPLRERPLTNRVTARYNRDYVFGGRGEDIYRRNMNMFGGDRADRIGDLRYYRQPYMTIGGTNTYRGTPEPFGYDRDYDDYDREFFSRL